MMLPSRGKGERLEEAIHQMIGDEGTEGYLVLWRAKCTVANGEMLSIEESVRNR